MICAVPGDRLLATPEGAAMTTTSMTTGVLTPFCRSHSMLGNVDQYAWAFGDLVRDLVRDAISLRYRLMPYIYIAFVTASQTGEPVRARAPAVGARPPARPAGT
jgi:alpha-glucosidase (family GH31 glycosyl hydrolase)